MFELDRISVSYGAAPALWDVSLTIQPGELVCVVGPNGAGKTTMINAMAGLQPVREGRMRFNQQDITRLPSHQFCEMGIAIVPEGRRLFTQMSVFDNLELGSFIPKAKVHRKKSLDWVLSLFPALEVKLNSMAGSLSGGQQQRAAIARTLVQGADLILADEPIASLDPE